MLIDGMSGEPQEAAETMGFAVCEPAFPLPLFEALPRKCNIVGLCCSASAAAVGGCSRVKPTTSRSTVTHFIKANVEKNYTSGLFHGLHKSVLCVFVLFFFIMEIGKCQLSQCRKSLQPGRTVAQKGAELL